MIRSGIAGEAQTGRKILRPITANTEATKKKVTWGAYLAATRYRLSTVFRNWFHELTMRTRNRDKISKFGKHIPDSELSPVEIYHHLAKTKNMREHED